MAANNGDHTVGGAMLDVLQRRAPAAAVAYQWPAFKLPASTDCPIADGSTQHFEVSRTEDPCVQHNDGCQDGCGASCWNDGSGT